MFNSMKPEISDISTIVENNHFYIPPISEVGS